jgi:hypothetical protein
VTQQGEPVKKTERQQEWAEVILVTDRSLTEPVSGDSDTVTSPPSDLEQLGETCVVEDEFAGRCSGCGEPVAPSPTGSGWVHAGLSDPWHPFAQEPLEPLLPPAEPPAWHDVPLWEPATCVFGHTGSRVNACEHDAVEGTQYCTIHADLA